MSDLNELVPPLKLCREISAKYPELFSDSALVWMHRTALDGISEEPFLVTNRLHAEHYKREMYPAPTLAELLEMLSTRVHGIEIHDCTCGWSIQIKTEEPELDFNPATAALRLLMKAKGVKQ